MSWIQATSGASCSLGKSHHEISYVCGCIRSQGGRRPPCSQVHNLARPEDDGLSLTLGSFNILPSDLESSSCTGVPDGTTEHAEGDGREKVHVDLDLGLAIHRGCQLTDGLPSSHCAPFVETEVLAIWQDASCVGANHIDNSSVQSARVIGRTSFASKGTFNNTPCVDVREVNLELGLSASCLSECLLDFGHGLQESRVDAFALGTSTVSDEGSTSARLMNSEGDMVPFPYYAYAKQSHVNIQGQSCVTLLTPIKKGVTQTRLNKVPEADLVPNNKDHVDSPCPMEDTSAGSYRHATSSTPVDRPSKMCKFKGCSKGARGASGLCIAHGGGRRCQKLNCNKGAEGRTMFCKAHGGGRRCQMLGCIKSAEGRTDFCIAHGGGRRCTFEGCSKAARGRSGLCIRHGGGKRCQRDGCTKSAEGFSGLCISHGGGRRCQYPGCAKGAQGSTKFCKGHGGGRRCEFEGCCKGAEGSTPFCKAHGGGKRCTFGGGICTKSVHGGTAFCVAHGGGKRCSVSGCTKSARGRTNYCVRHGGGKRCKFDDCNKSAQGSTDYCKAHGGGKRCSWGHEGSVCDGRVLEDQSMHLFKSPCDKFARGRTGLCSAHSALLEQCHPFGHSLSSSTTTTTASLHDSPSEPFQTEEFHPRPLSDANEQISGQEEDEHTFPGESPVGIIEDNSCRPQNQALDCSTYKTQATPSSVLIDAPWKEHTEFSFDQASPNKLPASFVPNLLQDRATGGSSFLHILNRSETHCQQNGLLQADLVTLSSSGKEINMNVLQQHINDSVRHSTVREVLEGRVHGGGHFMSLFTSNSARYE
ncbi:hypothetical protein KP509_26G070900 [Ceratopteris richardii]|nr:hypothetical protein KP509_26G070900 [Ceratopteris richardii]